MTVAPGGMHFDLYFIFSRETFFFVCGKKSSLGMIHHLNDEILELVGSFVPTETEEICAFVSKGLVSKGLVSKGLCPLGSVSKFFSPT